jgi:hypothetical protein
MAAGLTQRQAGAARARRVGQKFIFSWERGKEVYILRETEAATCTISRRASTFHGHGEGTLNGVPEFVANYTIKISSEEEVTPKVKIVNEQTREVVGRPRESRQHPVALHHASPLSIHVSISGYGSL